MSLLTPIWGLNINIPPWQSRPYLTLHKSLYSSTHPSCTHPYIHLFIRLVFILIFIYYFILSSSLYSSIHPSCPHPYIYLYSSILSSSLYSSIHPSCPHSYIHPFIHPFLILIFIYLSIMFQIETFNTAQTYLALVSRCVCVTMCIVHCIMYMHVTVINKVVEPHILKPEHTYMITWYHHTLIKFMKISIKNLSVFILNMY